MKKHSLSMLKVQKNADASSLAQSLGVELSGLPAGEATPSGDFLIILGTDKK